MSVKVRGNSEKYLSYKFAFNRINKAIEAQFPLEAIAIEESVMTDRFLSFANYYDAEFPLRTTLGQVAPKVAKICKQVGDLEGKGLAERASEWAKSRNQVLHSIAKSTPGTGPTLRSDTFLRTACGVADAGKLLTDAIKQWHQRRLRKSVARKTP